jgi:hypothetical protein
MSFRALGLAVLGLAAACLPAHAGKRTVCTITVNSPDEREVLRRSLPADGFDFVELVERGRPDWLAAACRRQVSCDVLVVSGHFAGTEFYSSRFTAEETLKVDEMERAICSESCPDLFASLKEVYLFGCDTLKPEPVKSAMPQIIRDLVRGGQSRIAAEQMARAASERHGENSRDLMRRLFANVPVIYGFSSLAPLGRTAGPMLQRHFEAGAADEFGSGQASARLLSLFGPASMVVTSGQQASEANADYRREVCRFFDDRIGAAQRLAFLHRLLGGEATELRMSFDRIESFFASLPAEERGKDAFVRAAGEVARDKAAADRYMALTRETEDPALRVRMIALARTVGWLSPADEQGELALMIHDVLAGGAMGFGEVDLICTLHRERGLDGSLQRLGAFKAKKVAQSAGLACLGSGEARARVLRALASTDEDEVQIAEAYLRHYPIEDAAELRKVARDVTRMKGSGAQVRALATLARQRIADREIIDELSRLFARTGSLEVQRAVAEIFIRSDARALPAGQLASLLRQHRLRAPGGGTDLIDALIERLHTS